MPVWNTDGPSTEAAAETAAETAAESGGGGGGGGDTFDLDSILNRVMKRAMSDPQFKQQIAQGLQQNGIPPRLLFDELSGGESGGETAATNPQPMTDQPDPSAQTATENAQTEAYQITPAEVRSLLDEVIAFAGDDVTLGELRDLDDGMIQTALDMSDLPS